jgi:hypothetical protein
MGNEAPFRYLQPRNTGYCNYFKRQRLRFWLIVARRSQTLTESLASYPETVSKHAAFHANASKVASAINAKKYTEAETMPGYGIPYEAAFSAASVSIIRLKKEAKL